MHRLFPDTNIVVSGLLFHGPEEALLLRAESGSFIAEDGQSPGGGHSILAHPAVSLSRSLRRSVPLLRAKPRGRVASGQEGGT